MKTNLETMADTSSTVELLRLELERCQRELDESYKRKEQMEDLFANVADAIFVAEPDGRIVNVNPAACELLDYSKEEFLAMRPWDFVTSASREEILDLTQNMRSGTPVTVQRTYCSKKGDHKIMDLRLIRCNLAARDLIIVSCRDVTEQKRLEERLRRSEKNLAEGQRLTKTGSWMLDYHTGNTDWSFETCRIFGFPDPPPSPHYSEFRARVRPEDRESVDRGLRESFETGEPRPLEYIFVLPDGVRKNIETISQPVRDETGAVVRLMGTVMDVTERKKAEEALRASERVARGQIETLKEILNSISTEPDPNKFLQHVLYMIAKQMGGQSVSVWNRDDDDNLSLAVTFEGNQLHLPTQETTLSTRDQPMWVEAFRTGTDCILTEFGNPIRMWLISRPDSEWIPRINDLTDRVAKAENERLAAQGVMTSLAVPTVMSGRVSGFIGIRFTEKREFQPEEIDLSRALAHQAMLAIQLMRLSRESQLAAVMGERNRMARDIHDTLAQGFTGVIMQLEAAKGATAQGNPAEVADRISRAGELARSSLEEARRSVRALRPSSLRDGTLSMALGDLLKRMTDGTGLNADFKAEGDERRIPAEFEEGLLRITQESLTNTVKHANARMFNATLNVSAGKIQLQLVDDGRGFNPQAESDGFGLIGMKERVDQMGGQFIIRSKLGVGTEILIVLKNETSLKPENGNEQA